MAIVGRLSRLVLVFVLLSGLYTTPAFSRLVETAGGNDDYKASLMHSQGISPRNRTEIFQAEDDHGRMRLTGRVKPIRGGRNNSTHMVDPQLGIENSLARAKYHMRRLERDGSREGWTFDSELDVQGRDLVQYQAHAMQIQIGTPPQDTLELVLDTGSSLVWTQCSPCDSCYPQAASLFDPSESSSYRRLTCDDYVCTTLMKKTYIIPSCSNGNCQYQASYGGSTSHSSGEMAFEDLTFGGGSGKAYNVAVGCSFTAGGDIETAFNPWADGLLGLDITALALNNQLGGKFSVCFLPYTAGSTLGTPMVFGNPSFPGDATGIAYTPMRSNHIKLAGYLYVDVVYISVNNEFLNIAPNTFKIDSSGQGGVIVDTGTTFSLLRPEAFDRLAAALLTLKPSDSPPIRGFGPCWPLDPAGIDAMNLPFIVINFNLGDMGLDVNAAYIQIETDQNYVCLAITRSEDNLGPNIIGNWQLNNQFILFDQQERQMQFAMYDCNKLAY